MDEEGRRARVMGMAFLVYEIGGKEEAAFGIWRCIRRTMERRSEFRKEDCAAKERRMRRTLLAIRRGSDPTTQAWLQVREVGQQ